MYPRSNSSRRLFGCHFQNNTTLSWSHLSLERLTTCSFDSWGSCRTPNCSSPSLCLHVYTTWLCSLPTSVHGRAIVSIVRRVYKISRCAASSSGYAAIVIKFKDPSRRSGHNRCCYVILKRADITYLGTEYLTILYFTFHNFSLLELSCIIYLIWRRVQNSFCGTKTKTHGKTMFASI